MDYGPDCIAILLKLLKMVLELRTEEITLRLRRVHPLLMLAVICSDRGFYREIKVN